MGLPCRHGDGTWCRSKYGFCGAGSSYCDEESQWIPDCGTSSPTVSPTASPTTSSPTTSPTTSPPTVSPTTSLPTMSPTTGQPNSLPLLDLDYHCRGSACPTGECRSGHGFCGEGEDYCNDKSRWIPECGTPPPTPSPTTVTPPLPSPVGEKSGDDGDGDESVPEENCRGNPCDADDDPFNGNDGTWCRSIVGFCGSGTLYCNSGSTWKPGCPTITLEESLASLGDNYVAENDEEVSTDDGSAKEKPTMPPAVNAVSSTPSPVDDSRFSDFARPTLTYIPPLKTDNERNRSPTTQSTTMSNAAASAVVHQVTGSTPDPTSSPIRDVALPWYEVYADVEPIPNTNRRRRSGGFCSAMPNTKLWVGMVVSVAYILFLL